MGEENRFGKKKTLCNQHPGASADTADLYILKFTVKIIFCLMCLETKKSVDCVCLNSLGLVCVQCCLSQVFSVKENISIYGGGIVSFSAFFDRTADNVFDVFWGFFKGRIEGSFWLFDGNLNLFSFV